MIMSPLETEKELTYFMSTQFIIKMRGPAKQQALHGGKNEGPERSRLKLTRYEPQSTMQKFKYSGLYSMLSAHDNVVCFISRF
jgi:hypothetical protein